MNDALGRVEARFEDQQGKVNLLVEQKMQESELKIKEAEILLRNVKGSFKSQNDKV